MTGIVVDTSALVAVLRHEPSETWLMSRLEASDLRLLTAATVVELGMVLEGRRPTATMLTSKVLRDADVTIVPFDEDLAQRALDAFRRFGRGRHPAALNLGDCFVHALAEREGLPILCVGDDFTRTDLDVLTPP